MRTVFLSLAAMATLAASPLVHAADGKAVYDSTCVACHASGVANAPEFGDKAAWGPRMAGGADALVKSAIAGKGAMPPKAGNPNLPEADIKAAVEFMLAAVK